MGATGELPVPVGDSPTGMGEVIETKRALGSVKSALAIPSGESPDGTGW